MKTKPNNNFPLHNKSCAQPKKGVGINTKYSRGVNPHTHRAQVAGSDKDKASAQWVWGFTLFEMIVAIFVFSFLLVAITAGFTQALKIQRRAFNIQDVQENANFVLEFMAREARVSEVLNKTSDPACPLNLPSVVLCLDHPANGNVIYSLSGNEIHRSVNGTDSIISANKVEFTKMDFYITGSDIGDGLQPRITIAGSVRSLNSSEQAELKFQTTVSQRLLSN